MTNGTAATNPADDGGSQHLRGILIVGAGVVVISFEAVLIRLVQADSWTVAFWRGIFIVVSLGSLLAVRGGLHTAITAIRAGGRAALASGIGFGASSLLFILSIMHTKAANTVVILSAAPLFAALLTYAFLGEAVRLRTWLAILASVAGVVVVFYGSLGSGGLVGDLCGLGAAAVLGGNLTLLRRNRELPRIPLVCMGGLFAVLVTFPIAQPFGLPWQSYVVLAVMGVIQMPLAQVLMATGTRYLTAPEVSLFLLIEVVLAPVWVWLAVGEEPPGATFLGGAVIIVTLGVHSWLSLRSAQRRLPRP